MDTFITDHQIDGYYKSAKRTLAPVDHITEVNARAAHLAHSLMGFAGEFGEAIQAMTNMDTAHIREELSDMCWYYVVLRHHARVFGANGDAITEEMYRTQENAEVIDDIARDTVYNCIDLSKRLVFYKQTFEKPTAKANLLKVVKDIGLILMLFARDAAELDAENAAKYSFDELFNAALRKLEVRYPDKFNTDASVDRKTDAEMEALLKPLLN